MKKLIILLFTLSLLNAGIWRNETDQSYRGYNGSTSSSGIVITSANRVAVGKTTAAEKIDVSGNVKATSFIGDLAGTANNSITANYSETSNTANYLSSYDITVSTANALSSYDITVSTANALSSYDITVSTADYATTANYSNNSDKLDSQEGSYYTNATNISSGTLNNDRLASTVVTANYSSAVTISGTLTVGAYTFPVADGISGQVLKTDGSGILAWYNESGGGGASATKNIVNKTASYTATTSDDFITCSGNITITLYTAIGNTGKELIIKNLQSTTINVQTTLNQTIDNDTTTKSILYQYDAMRIISNGSKWLQY